MSKSKMTNFGRLKMYLGSPEKEEVDEFSKILEEKIQK